MAVIDEAFATSDPKANIRAEQRAINAANAGKKDAEGNEFVPLAVDGIAGPLTEAARAFVAVEEDDGTNGVPSDDGAQKEPADNVQDKEGNWLYIQNAAGAWYNHPAFIHEEEDEEEDEEETETEKETRLALDLEKQKAINLQLENDALRLAGQ